MVFRSAPRGLLGGAAARQLRRRPNTSCPTWKRQLRLGQFATIAMLRLCLLLDLPLLHTHPTMLGFCVTGAQQSIHQSAGRVTCTTLSSFRPLLCFFFNRRAPKETPQSTGFGSHGARARHRCLSARLSLSLCAKTRRASCRASGSARVPLAAQPRGSIRRAGARRGAKSTRQT